MWLLAKAFFATPVGILSLAVIAGFVWLKAHDMKIKSRVIETSKREANDDVKTSTQAHSSSLSASRGVRSSYRRD